MSDERWIDADGVPWTEAFPGRYVPVQGERPDRGKLPDPAEMLPTLAELLAARGPLTGGTSTDR